MKQECRVAMIYGSRAFYAAGLLYLSWHGRWVPALGWLVACPLAISLYGRVFPRISAALGYGQIVDEFGDEPGEKVGHARLKVKLYTALGCPFCPLIEQRLEILQRQTGFELEKVDVTLRPDLLASKGIRSVPTVEVGGRMLVGLVTTKEIAAAILEAQPVPAAT